MSKRKGTDMHTHVFLFFGLFFFYVKLHFLMFWYVTLEKKSFSMLKTEFANMIIPLYVFIALLES